MEENELNDMLESALKDFEENDENDEDNDEDNENNENDILKDATMMYNNAKNSEINHLKENMNKFLKDAENPEFQDILEKTFKELNNNSNSNNNSNELEILLKTLKKDNNINQDNHINETMNVDIEVAETMKSLSKASEDINNMNTSKVEEMGEEMMKEMMKKFEILGEKKDFPDVIDGMMQQLLSKDVMYEPMKQICEEYPVWLAEKENLLSKEDYIKYGKQYQYFQRIIAVYEYEPENYDRLSELLQDLQDYGQPPSEIVTKLAPGLEFDNDGMPIMQNLGDGMFPGFPNNSLPTKDQCCLM